MIHIDAIYDHGVFRPVQPLALPEGTRVRLRVDEDTAAADAGMQGSDSEAPNLLNRLKDVVGSIDDLPEDSSANLDHYLYGRPKR